jgi:hypothetical protein
MTPTATLGLILFKLYKIRAFLRQEPEYARISNMPSPAAIMIESALVYLVWVTVAIAVNARQLNAKFIVFNTVRSVDGDTGCS